MGNGLLSIEDLCAGYPGQEVLHQVSAELKSGKITILTGPNGCGKSTLLKTIIGLVPKIRGTVCYEGCSVENFSSVELAKRIAYLPQNKSIPDLTVMTMVLHGRFAHLQYPRRYREADMAAAKEALRITELSEYAEKNIATLSGGTQQRVFLAMALAQNAPVILMDEPNSFMDISHQIKLMETCRRLADNGKAVVMVLHDLSAALRYGDEIGVMSQGRLAAFGTPEEIYESGILNDVFHVNIQRVDTKQGHCYYYE